MWSQDVYSCDTIHADLPLCVPGEAVSHRWPRVSRPEVPTSPRKVHQTHTSSDAPSFLASTTLNGVSPRLAPPLPPEGFLTHVQRRRRVILDPQFHPTTSRTQVSIDSPEWIASTGREHAPHLEHNVRLTKPRAMYRLGASSQAVITPLVEIDPFTGKPPRALPKPFAGPGYIPIPAERAQVEAHYASTGRDRLGLTFGAEVGAGEGGGGLLDGPSATKPPRERFGATAAAAIGDMRQGGALVDTLQFEEEAAPPRMLVSGAVYRSEPPYSDYFVNKREELGLPSLRDTHHSARWRGVGPSEYRQGHNTLHSSLSPSYSSMGGSSGRGGEGGSGGEVKQQLASQRLLESVQSKGASAPVTGHALFRALTNTHGDRAAQHLSIPFSVAKETVGPATLQLTASNPQSYRPTFKSGPLHCT